MSKGQGVTEELKRIYQQAWDEGYWIREFDGYLAAAGSIKQLEEIGKESGKEIIVNELTLADVVMGGIASTPGNGSTREEACLDELRNYKEYEQKKDEPLSLYGSFEERGYKVEAYIPNSSEVAREFVVRAYSGEKLVEEMKVPMVHEPVFGVDVEDKETLEHEVEKLIQKLTTKRRTNRKRNTNRN